MCEKLTGKLAYVENIREGSRKYERVFFDENVTSVDTSDIESIEKKFIKVFPMICEYAKRENDLLIEFDRHKTKIHCINLNTVLKSFAILNGYKFDGKEIDKKEIYSFKENFQYMNQMHYTKSKFPNEFYDSSPLSTIFALAESEYQAWLTMYCLFIKIPDIFANIVFRCYRANYNKQSNWSLNLYTFNARYLDNGIFLPKERSKAKEFYKNIIKNHYINEPLSANTEGISKYKKKTDSLIYRGIKSLKFTAIQSQILYFISMNNFEIFSLYIKALTYFEAHQCLTGNDLFINKLQHYFNLNKDKDKFLKQFITNMNKKFAFNLFCFIKGEANEEILTELIKKFNRTRVYIEDNKIASIILSLKDKYPNNEEIDKYISKRLILEMQ